MSLNSKESPTSPMPVLAEAPAAEARDPAGQLLTRLTVLPVLLTVAWLLAGLPLLLLGWFRPAPQIALFCLVAAVLVPVTLRCVPTLASPALQRTPGKQGRTPWWPVAAMVIIASWWLQHECWEDGPAGVCVDDRVTVIRARHIGELIPRSTHRFEKAREPAAADRAVKGEPNHLLSWEDASLATMCMFAAQESIRLGAEIDLDQFHRSLLAPAEVPGAEAEDAEERDASSEGMPPGSA